MSDSILNSEAQGDRSTLIAGPLFVIAAAIRIAVNDVAIFSRADETVYLLYAKTLATGGSYGRIVRMFLDDRGMWVLPNPLRWSYIGAASLFCSITGDATQHALATLSTVAGIAAVALTYWIARSLFGPTVALVAIALAATSPLQLALGRRALSDEFFCAAFLVSIAVLISYVREQEPRRRTAWLVAWVAVTTLTIAAKEQFLLIYPAVILFWWLRSRRIGRREVIAWVLPPILFAGVFSILAGDAGSFFRIMKILSGIVTTPYATAYGSGPPQRLLIDFLAVAPIVTMLAIAVVVFVIIDRAEQSAELRHLTLLAVAIYAIHALFPSQDLRYVVPVDALMRIMAAAFVVAQFRGRPRIIAAALAVNAAVELFLFRTIFVVAAVYDPMTDNLMRALRMIP